MLRHETILGPLDLSQMLGVKPACVKLALKGAPNGLGENQIRLLSAAGGAVVLAIIGFNWGGWVTTGTAETMAKEIAANAVAERLGSICVAQANRDPQKGQKLNEMKGKDAWERGRYIEKLSWAIMPGDEKADSKVADACAKHFTEKISYSRRSDSLQIAG